MLNVNRQNASDQNVYKTKNILKMICNPVTGQIAD